MKKSMGMVMVVVLMAAAVAWAEAPYAIGWARQFGTSGDEDTDCIAIDSSSNLYITGRTTGNLGGTNAGGRDAFVARYDTAGNQVWSRQFGSSGDEQSKGVAVDGTGNIYVTGYTSGSLVGSTAGGYDGFLTKYSAVGERLWTKQFGTSADDYMRSVATDSSGNVYISGFTSGALGGAHAGSTDIFFAKYDHEGNQVWARQIGTPGGDASWGISVDSTGNTFVCGYADGNLGGSYAGSYDAFLTKYDSEGNKTWSKQIGSSNQDYANAPVAFDSAGNIYMTGWTSGSMSGPNAGVDDAFLTKLNAEGKVLWTKQWGTSASDQVRSVAVDAAGNAFIGGETYGSLGGPSAGDQDAYLTKIDTAGNLLWTKQFGTGLQEYGSSVVLDAAGNVYFTGLTYGSLFGTTAGREDIFLAQFAVPEPATLGLLALSGVFVLRRRQ